MIATFNPTALRKRFPALSRQQDGRAVLYFDNPAGTQVPQETIDGYVRYLEQCNANSHGTFATSRESDAVVDAAHIAAGDFLNASSGEIVFGPNMTTLTFALSRAIGRTLQSGDEIVTTRLEHDANVSPWLALQERGVTVRFIEINSEDMTLDLESAEKVIGPRTRVVAVGLASNAFGTINNVRRIADLAHAHNALVFCDAVHFGPHGPIDVAALDVDFLACSSYKFFGPHLGMLYGRRRLLEDLAAYRVRPAGDIPPGKWETGTQNHEALSAFIGTMSYLGSLVREATGHHPSIGDADPDDDRRELFREAMTQIRAYERTLSERLIGGMSRIPGMRIFGIIDPAQFDHRVPTVSFRVGAREPLEVAEALGDEGIFSWAGNHYAIEPLGRLGLEATNRIGLVHYNTPDEIDRFLEALEGLAA